MGTQSPKDWWRLEREAVWGGGGSNELALWSGSDDGMDGTVLGTTETKDVSLYRAYSYWRGTKRMPSEGSAQRSEDQGTHF